MGFFSNEKDAMAAQVTAAPTINFSSKADSVPWPVWVAGAAVLFFFFKRGGKK